jgi:hypothetical protein
MPLTRLKSQFLEQEGVRFVMRDGDHMVPCVVPHEALRKLASLGAAHGTDGDVFEAYRDLVEQLASDAYDADGPFDLYGRILITPDAVDCRQSKNPGSPRTLAQFLTDAWKFAKDKAMELGWIV